MSIFHGTEPQIKPFHVRETHVSRPGPLRDDVLQPGGGSSAAQVLRDVAGLSKIGTNKIAGTEVCEADTGAGKAMENNGMPWNTSAFHLFSSLFIDADPCRSAGDHRRERAQRVPSDLAALQLAFQLASRA